MKRCVECKGTLEQAQTDEDISIGAHRIVLTLPARRCTACSEIYVAGDVAARADLLVASRLLDLGIATGQAFRFMRKALGLRATDLAELLGIDAATVSRWETGKVEVDRCALTTLAAAATERLKGHDETLGRLRVLQEGKRPNRAALHLDFAKAS